MLLSAYGDYQVGLTLPYLRPSMRGGPKTYQLSRTVLGRSLVCLNQIRLAFGLPQDGERRIFARIHYLDRFLGESSEKLGTDFIEYSFWKARRESITWKNNFSLSSRKHGKLEGKYDE